MRPILFRLWKLEIHSYGFMLSIAFITGILLAMRRARRENLDPDVFLDLGLVVLISAIVGARLVFILVNLSSFIHQPLEMFKIWKGGMVFYGGFLGALSGGIIYVKYWTKMPVWHAADVTAPSIALGLTFTRIGCFLNGCCYGGPTHMPWGVLFPFSRDARYSSLVHGFLRCSNAGHPEVGVFRHPTQIYESMAGLVMFLILTWWMRRIRRRDGVVFFSFAAAYAVWRSMVEIIRTDARGQLLFIYGPKIRKHVVWVEQTMDAYLRRHPHSAHLWLSTSQLISIALFTGSMIFLARRWMNKPLVVLDSFDAALPNNAGSSMETHDEQAPATGGIDGKSDDIDVHDHTQPDDDKKMSEDDPPDTSV